jgi:hypothetical protein
MEAILTLILFILPSIVLVYAIYSKSIQLKKSIDVFNKNKKVIEDLDLSDYKLGTSHIYSNMQ